MLTESKEVGALSMPNVPSHTAEKTSAFVKSIAGINFMQPDGNPKPKWKVFYGRTVDEARQSASEYVKQNVSEKIRLRKDGAINEGNAIWKAADGMLYDAHSIVENATMESNREEAQMLARLATSSRIKNTMKQSSPNVKDDAVRDAIFMAKVLTVSDMDLMDRKKYMKYAEERFDVWRKGYGLLYDVGGTFYVYCKGVQPQSSSEVKQDIDTIPGIALNDSMPLRIIHPQRRIGSE